MRAMSWGAFCVALGLLGCSQESKDGGQALDVGFIDGASDGDSARPDAERSRDGAPPDVAVDASPPPDSALDNDVATDGSDDGSPPDAQVELRDAAVQDTAHPDVTLDLAVAPDVAVDAAIPDALELDVAAADAAEPDAAEPDVFQPDAFEAPCDCPRPSEWTMPGPPMVLGQYDWFANALGAPDGDRVVRFLNCREVERDECGRVVRFSGSESVDCAEECTWLCRNQLSGSFRYDPVSGAVVTFNLSARPALFGRLLPETQEWTHEFDAAGRRTSSRGLVASENRDGELANRQYDVEYTYDDAGRLLTVAIDAWPDWHWSTRYEHDDAVTRQVTTQGAADPQITRRDHPPLRPLPGPICDWEERACPDGSVELWNDADDDCDGVVDEGLAGGPCVGPEAPDQTCLTGSMVQIDGELACIGALAARPEQCNLGDDDCDGLVDEGLEGECACDPAPHDRVPPQPSCIHEVPGFDACGRFVSMSGCDDNAPSEIEDGWELCGFVADCDERQSWAITYTAWGDVLRRATSDDNLAGHVGRIQTDLTENGYDSQGRLSSSFDHSIRNDKQLDIDTRTFRIVRPDGTGRSARLEYHRPWRVLGVNP